MTDQAPYETTDLAPDSDSPMAWSRMRDLLAAPPPPNTPGGHFPTYLGTVRPNGLPHATGVGARWYDGDMYFTSGPDARKARNLAANPACTISVRLAGIDVVFEGEAERVTDPDVLEALAAVYRQGGWPAQVEGDAFTAPYSAPSAGPPPWHLYRLDLDTAIGVAAAEPHGATRWRFA